MSDQASPALPEGAADGAACPECGRNIAAPGGFLKPHRGLGQARCPGTACHPTAPVAALPEGRADGLEVEFTKRRNERDWVRIKRHGIVQVEGFIANDLPPLLAAPVVAVPEAGEGPMGRVTDLCTVCDRPNHAHIGRGHDFTPAPVVGEREEKP